MNRPNKGKDGAAKPVKRDYERPILKVYGGLAGLTGKFDS
jgi:hypothetical protein